MVTGDRERQDSWTAMLACVRQLVKLDLSTQGSLVLTCSCTFLGQGFPCYFAGSIQHCDAHGWFHEETGCQT